MAAFDEGGTAADGKGVSMVSGIGKLFPDGLDKLLGLFLPAHRGQGADEAAGTHGDAGPDGLPGT